MTSVEDLAKVSEAVYLGGIPIDGYNVINAYDIGDTGFYLDIYKSQAGQDYIFSFRGTQDFQDAYVDLKLGIPQWLNDDINQEILEYIRGIALTGAHISFTGHSLGGVLAQYAAYEYAVASSDQEKEPDEFAATFDLVTFNAPGGELGLGDLELYPSGYDESVADSIPGAHYRIVNDVVSRLGNGHIGGELFTIFIPVESPLFAHQIGRFTGSDTNSPLTAEDYANAVSTSSVYLDITSSATTSGILASIGDDEVFTQEEALLRTLSGFAFALTRADSGDLTELVEAFFGDPSITSPSVRDAWGAIGQQAIVAFQHSPLSAEITVSGAYSLLLANLIQRSTDYWGEHPGFADAVGMTVEYFIENVAEPAASIIGSALDYALENEIVAEAYQDAVDFVSNLSRWVTGFFDGQSSNRVFVQGTEGDDVLRSTGARWPWETENNFLYAYSGNDLLEGGVGDDLLVGGSGADRYIWNSGDGNDLIGDHDDAGDRIIVNGLDLADLSLRFERTSPDAPYYVDKAHPDITLHYQGSVLTINIGSGPDAGSITATEYAPAGGRNYGIVLHDYTAEAPVTDITVTNLGSSDLTADNETDPIAYSRQTLGQRGLDWSSIALTFEAVDVPNYSGGTLHGTLGGAFEGGPLDDHLVGDPGSNALHGLGGDDLIEGGAGNDFLEGGAGSDTLAGGDGSDLLFGSARAGLVEALDPADSRGRFYLQQMAGEPGDADVLDGGPGDDYVTGGEYNDHVDGGAGRDYLLGGAGSDFISGGADRDVIYGDSALHYRLLEPTPGVADERLEIAFADGTEATGQYDDVIHAGAGDDTVWGELGDDTLYGEGGDDNLIGDRYDDIAYFSAELPAYGDTSPALAASLQGDDRLYGGVGSDLLLGLGGDDFLAGGADADSLVGGTGDDTYALGPGDGLDHIEDSEGVHTLLFSGITTRDLQVRFQGDEVFVGTGYGTEGFNLARNEWANVRIALDSPDGVVPRSSIDTLYFDGAGNLLLTVNGSRAMTEADRDALFTVDDSDPDKPRVLVGAGADSVQIDALTDESGGANLQVTGGGLQLILYLTARQLASGLDFLSLADGIPIYLSGFTGDVSGSGADDHIIGSGSADILHGGNGDDLLEGRGGNDRLDGGAGSDILRGDSGDDILEGGGGNDVYAFARGDGQDRIYDPSGSHVLVFDASVNPDSVVFHYTGTSDTRFRLEYGSGDAIISEGGLSSYWIGGITVAGAGIPLVQRSDLADGVFHDTRWHDVFEPGPGADTIHVTGWGDDVFRFASGDGQDRIVVDTLYYPELKGDIRFAAGVDLDSVSFGFQNGDAVITYGQGDQVTLDTDSLFSFRDNTLARFTLTSEVDPAWIPTIRAEGYVGRLHGSFGTDHLIGNDNVETIIPGYGDDLIEAGGGPDRIVLNDVYMRQGTEGIGHKHIRGGEGNDVIETPLHQGLSIYYDRGDGYDSIQYDWSYKADSFLGYPYQFSVDYAQNTAALVPKGQDTLVFGAGIALSDLRFIRFGQTLVVELIDGSGGIELQDFFHAWDAEPPAEPVDLAVLFGEGTTPDTLLDPYLLTFMPPTPISFLRFDDGSEYEMPALLASFLEISEVTLRGTPGSDTLLGTGADDIIQALGGSDEIQDPGGNNVIDAGEGDDQIILSGGVNLIEPGPGTDFVVLTGGENVVRFGPGSGHDISIFHAEAATLVLEMADGITPRDIAVTTQHYDWGDLPVVSLSATGDSFVPLPLVFDSTLGDYVPDTTVTLNGIRFADGTLITGEAFLAMAFGPPGELVEGGAGNDDLAGTEGGDTLVGADGNDTLTGYGGTDTLLGGTGNDRLFGSSGNDVLAGGAGNDVLSGGAGDDTYRFAAGDGRDTLLNDDADPASHDVLEIDDAGYDELWFSRSDNHLMVNRVGTNDRIKIKDWYANEGDQIDAIYTPERVLLRDQVDLLVSAMAAFDVPDGVGAVIPQETRSALEPTLTAVWQLAA